MSDKKYTKIHEFVMPLCGFAAGATALGTGFAAELSEVFANGGPLEVLVESGIGASACLLGASIGDYLGEIVQTCTGSYERSETHLPQNYCVEKYGE